MHSNIRRVLLLALLAMTSGFVTFAEEAAAPAGRKGLLVLPTTDTSGLNLATPLQYGLAQLYQQESEFDVKLSSYVLSGFTEPYLKKAYAALGASMLTFVYIEKERISLFLFDPAIPKKFVVATDTIVEPDQPVSSESIEAKFRKTYAELLSAYRAGQFQMLPGASVDAESMSSAEEAETKQRAEEARTLFRELTSLQERTYYFGSHVGMARFGDGVDAAATINFGLLFGLKATEQLRAELGLEFFSYAMAHIDGRYVLPLEEKYVTVSATFGVAQILSVLTANRGFVGTNLQSGGIMFGPGVGIDIPMLGANIRGDIRLYFGGGTVLIGSYGIVYSI